MKGKELRQDILNARIDHKNVSGVIDTKEETVNIPTMQTSSITNGNLKLKQVPIRPQIYELEEK